MLNSPRLGTKKQTIDKILLKVPMSPQRKTAIDALIPKNPFCTFTAFKCSITLDFMLQAEERMRTVAGFMGMPRKESCWKNVWSPEVVAVSVRVIRSRVICRAVWWFTSSPK